MKWLTGLASMTPAAGALRSRLGALAKLTLVPVILTLPLVFSSVASAQWYDFTDDYGTDIYEDDYEYGDDYGYAYGDYGYGDYGDVDYGDDYDYGYSGYGGYGYGDYGYGDYGYDSYYTDTWFEDDDEFYDWYD